MPNQTMEAQRFPAYAELCYDDDATVIIVRPEGDYAVRAAELDGSKIIVEGYALDETHGKEEITERYDATEVIEFYVTFI